MKKPKTLPKNGGKSGLRSIRFSAVTLWGFLERVDHLMRSAPIVHRYTALRLSCRWPAGPVRRVERYDAWRLNERYERDFFHNVGICFRDQFWDRCISELQRFNFVKLRSVILVGLAVPTPVLLKFGLWEPTAGTLSIR